MKTLYGPPFHTLPEVSQALEQVPFYFGLGSPEGVLVAKRGLYVDMDGGTGSTLYVKESGTDEFGWVAK